MAVRQYIGARYVPEFFSGTGGSAEWVSGIAYDALTVVTRLGNSFTSRKPVPSNIGAPESNPEYWVCTGNFNSQLASLSEQVSEFEDEIAYRTTEKYIVIGDSLMFGSDGTLYGGFVNRAFRNLGIAQDNYFTSGASGAGFTAGNTFINQLNAILTIADDDFKSSHVRVIVIGGMNDDYDALEESGVYTTAAKTFAERAKEVLPDCTLEYLPLNWAKSYTQRMKLRELWEVETGGIQSLPNYGFNVYNNCFGYIHDYLAWFKYDSNTEIGSGGITQVMKLFQHIIMCKNDYLNLGFGAELINYGSTLVDGQDVASVEFNTIRECYDGQNVTLVGEGTITAKETGLTFSNNVNSPTILLASNVFRYINACPYTDAKYYGEFLCYLRGANNAHTEASLFIDKNGKTAIYVRTPLSLAENGTCNIKMLGIPVPKNNC